MAHYKRSVGVSPPAEVVAAVQRMVDETSEAETAKKLGIGASTVRALRGALTVRPGTIALVQARLAKQVPGATEGVGQ